MDLLHDLLKVTGLKSRVIGFRSFASDVAIEFPCEKSIGFHVVTQGQAFIHRGGRQKPLALQKGDIALMARSRHHIVSTQLELPKKMTPLSEFDRTAQVSEVKESGERSKVTLVSGAYQLWHDPVHPFFNDIPDWFVLRSNEMQSFDSLNGLIQLLAVETSTPGLGSDQIVKGILDVMFALIVRRIVAKAGERENTFSYALQNQQIRKALELLHADVAKPWTVQDLAKEVGLSRAGFALKFRKAMGDTPLHYLTTLRIQVAMDLLGSTDNNIESIALQVGYQDAFSFSKAFKKLTGLPPRDFRSRDSDERKVSARF